MANPATRQALAPRPQAPLALPYAYLLRFPLLTVVVLLGLAPLSLTRARPLLGNLFDLNVAGIFVVSLVTFTSVWAVMVSARVVFLCGHERFGYRQLKWLLELRWYHLVLYGLIAVPTLAGVFWLSDPPWWQKLWAAAAGLMISLVSLVAARFMQFLLTPPRPAGEEPKRSGRSALPTEMLIPLPHSRLFEWAAEVEWPRRAAEAFRRLFSRVPPRLGCGYFKYGDDHKTVVSVMPGHALALVLFAASLAVYFLIGSLKYDWLGMNVTPNVPSLAYVLILVMLLCWGLSGLSFFLDRYRVPVLVPFIVWLVVTSQSSVSDYYYKLEPRPAELRQMLPPAAVLTAGGAVKPNGKRSVIVVASNGGGIQAAAWTARVLTGLEEQSRKEWGGAYHGEFGKLVRLISAVSGGSVGTMYFADAYTPSGLAPDRLSRVFADATGSCLDEVAWGLVYPDLQKTIFPWWRRPVDRGAALAAAWEMRAPGVGRRLSEWREDARHGWRPACIFNATTAELGQRLLLSTTDLTGGQNSGQNFTRYFTEHDISVATAARLSAAFPYVSPAARADEQAPVGADFHVVDGGYYDNYGMATLIEWLDEGLSQARGQVDKVLVLQLRAAPDEVGMAAQPERGWFYQTFAPLGTLLHVRNTGQLSHNDKEFSLLTQVWKSKPESERVEIQTAVFSYGDKDPPLSWHLTSKQIADVERDWVKKVTDPRERAQWLIVKDFVNEAWGNK